MEAFSFFDIPVEIYAPLDVNHEDWMKWVRFSKDLTVLDYQLEMTVDAQGKIDALAGSIERAQDKLSGEFDGFLKSLRKDNAEGEVCQ